MRLLFTDKDDCFYTSLDQKTFSNERKSLTLRERGLLAYLLSQKDGYQIGPSEIAEKNDISKSTAKRLVNSLEKKGYLHKGPVDYSLSVRVEYVVAEAPKLIEAFLEESPWEKSRDLEEPKRNGQSSAGQGHAATSLPPFDPSGVLFPSVVSDPAKFALRRASHEDAGGAGALTGVTAFAEPPSRPFTIKYRHSLLGRRTKAPGQWPAGSVKEVRTIGRAGRRARKRKMKISEAAKSRAERKFPTLPEHLGPITSGKGLGGPKPASRYKNKTTPFICERGGGFKYEPSPLKTRSVGIDSISDAGGFIDYIREAPDSAVLQSHPGPNRVPAPLELALLTSGKTLGHLSQPGHVTRTGPPRSNMNGGVGSNMTPPPSDGGFRRVNPTPRFTCERGGGFKYERGVPFYRQRIVRQTIVPDTIAKNEVCRLITNSAGRRPPASTSQTPDSAAQTGRKTPGTTPTGLRWFVIFGDTDPARTRANGKQSGESGGQTDEESQDAEAKDQSELLATPPTAVSGQDEQDLPEEEVPDCIREDRRYDIDFLDKYLRYRGQCVLKLNGQPVRIGQFMQVSTYVRIKAVSLGEVQQALVKPEGPAPREEIASNRCSSHVEYIEDELDRRGITRTEDGGFEREEEDRQTLDDPAGRLGMDEDSLFEAVWEPGPDLPRTPVVLSQDERLAEKHSADPETMMHLRRIAQRKFDFTKLDYKNEYGSPGPEPWAIRLYEFAFPQASLSLSAKQKIDAKVVRARPVSPSEWASVLIHGIEQDWHPGWPSNFCSTYRHRLGIEVDSKSKNPAGVWMSKGRIERGQGIDLTKISIEAARPKRETGTGAPPDSPVSSPGRQEEDGPSSPRMSPMESHRADDLPEGEDRLSPHSTGKRSRRE
jgi:DNA-binding MarR family transcriptional regulator